MLTHKLWEKEGIRIDRSGTPLNEVPNPVVSIFSTGVLEAAIRGIPAWVYHPAPPAWLVESGPLRHEPVGPGTDPRAGSAEEGTGTAYR